MNQNARGANVLNLRSSLNEVEAKRISVRADLEKARAETAVLRKEAAVARATAETARARLLRSKRDNKVRLRVTAVIMMTGALIRIGWEAASTPDPVASPMAAKALAAASNPARTVDLALQKAQDPTLDESQGGKALERVRDAFHLFPELDQSEVVKEVNERYTGDEMTCPIAWNDGKPVLFIGDKQGQKSPSVAEALNRCATGIERWRAEEDAQQQPLK